MLPKDHNELEKIRQECKKMATSRAGISGAASLVPVPGTDVATDVVLLVQLLPEINRRFGLTPEQIDQLNPEMKTLIYNLLRKSGAEFAGRAITKQAIVAVLKRMGIKIGTRQVAKYIPLIGQTVAFAISFGAMKFVGNQHINECYNLVKGILDSQQDI